MKLVLISEPALGYDVKEIRNIELNERHDGNQGMKRTSDCRKVLINSLLYIELNEFVYRLGEEIHSSLALYHLQAWNFIVSNILPCITDPVKTHVILK